MGPSTETRFFIILVSGPELAIDSQGLSFEDGPEPPAFDGNQPLDGAAVESSSAYINCISAAYSRVDAARGQGIGFIIVQDLNL
jgi:hypothetical protein